MVRRIAWLTAIAGSVIFAAITVGLFSPQSYIRIPAITALVTFSAIILSHLGGIENGLALREEASTEATRAIALALSIVPSLAAWGVLWLPTPRWQVGAALALFAAVWAADLWLSRHGLIPAWFVDMRTAVTAVVCVILAVAWWLL
ncbi:MAG TPA: DUF3429 domain-containing protein [Usitatibacter sp.]|nr:DUF3429 domain-containing protein [Usitatibacter sp.]